MLSGVCHFICHWFSNETHGQLFIVYYNEFVNMATDGEFNGTDLLLGKILNKVYTAFGIENEDIKSKAEQYDLYKDQFDRFSFDENKETINAGEVASVLYTADIDIENFNKTEGDVASSIDGKLNYIEYEAQALLDSSSQEYESVILASPLDEVALDR